MEKNTFEDEMLIPKERVPVLIGEKGKVKRAIEREGKVKLDIDSKGNSVNIKATDAFDLHIAKNVIGAIARGFNPKIAQNLFKEGTGYEVINLYDYGAKSKTDLKRLKGLIIGTGGKARKIIEDYTESDIAVYGKTIAIIGPLDKISLARRAIEKLLTGATHGAAFMFLKSKMENGG